MTRLAIIGGGAAGMFCAANVSGKVETVVFESAKNPLGKVKVSGGGRCNFTNEFIDSKNIGEFYPRGAGSLKKPMKRFGAKDTRTFFRSLGVESKTEDSGRVFPACDDSQAIIAALEKKSLQNGAKIELSARITGLSKNADGTFSLFEKGAPRGPFDAVVLAVGGNICDGLKKSLENLGISANPPAPSLFSVKTDTASEQAWRGMAGVSIPDAKLDAEFSIGRSKPASVSARGALLFTHFGIGGPAALKFSSFGAREFQREGYNFAFSANFAPAYGGAERNEAFLIARRNFPKKKVSNLPLFGLPQRFWTYAANRAGINPDTTFSNLPKSRENALAPFVSARKEELMGKNKSASSPLSMYGFRTGQTVVRNITGKPDDAIAYELFEAARADCAKAKYSLDKRGIQKALKNGDAHIEELFEMEVVERFYVEPKTDKDIGE